MPFDILILDFRIRSILFVLLERVLPLLTLLPEERKLFVLAHTWYETAYTVLRNERSAPFPLPWIGRAVHDR